MIAVEPEAELVKAFDAAGGTGRPRVGQVPISWDPSRDAAIDRAHDQFRWFGGGWKVNAELPGMAGFAAASQYVQTAFLDWAEKEFLPALADVRASTDVRA